LILAVLLPSDSRDQILFRIAINDSNLWNKLPTSSNANSIQVHCLRIRAASLDEKI